MVREMGNPAVAAAHSDAMRSLVTKKNHRLNVIAQILSHYVFPGIVNVLALVAWRGYARNGE